MRENHILKSSKFILFIIYYQDNPSKVAKMAGNVEYMVEIRNASGIVRENAV